MTGFLIAMAAGLAAGGVIGFVMGLESPKRCGSCRDNTVNRYKAGLRDGWADGARAMAEAVRTHSETTVDVGDLLLHEIDSEELARLEQEIGGTPDIYI